MTETFDPYYRWLGIGPDEQPANHYRLLGVKPFEDDPVVIETAADRQTVHLRTFQIGPTAEIAKKLLDEVATARACLLNPTMKMAYDEGLERPSASGASQAASPADRQFEALLAEADAAEPSQLAPLKRRRRINPWLVVGVVASMLVLIVVGVISLMIAAFWSFDRTFRSTIDEALTTPPNVEKAIDEPLVPRVEKRPKKRSPAALTGSAKKSAKPPLLFTLSGHSRPVCALAFSPDGKILVSGSKDGTVRLWDVATGRMAWAQPVHASEVNSVAFSPDGKIIASAGDDRTIQLLDAADGKTIRTIKGHERGIRALAFSPDGKRLASAGHGEIVRLWNVATGEPIGQWKAHDDSIMTLGFSPDGKRLVSGSLDQSVRLWDPTAQQLTHTFAGHEAAVRAVDWVNAERFVSVGEDGRWIEWQVDLDDPIQVQRDRDDRLLAVAANPKGTRIAVAGRGADGAIRFWDLASGKSSGTISGHEKPIGVLVISSDGRILASGGYDGVIMLWDVEAAQ